METGTKLVHGVQVGNPVPFLLSEHAGGDRDSCFYKLGDARSAVYGAYVERPMPKTIMKRIDKCCEN